jgi:predicted Zn-dependent peptidase
VEKAIYEELDRVQSGGITDQELQKAKNIQLAAFYRQMKTINGKASALATYEVYFGDYRKLLTAADDFAKVTKEDVQRVARAYFAAKNRTVATLVPEAQPASAPAKQ